MGSFEEIIQANEAQAVSGLKLSEPDIGQRSAAWFEQRKGKFTGSGLANLMSCSRAKARAAWGEAEKTIDFGKTAVKYIYEKAMELKADKVVHLPTNKAMQYGTEFEPVSIDMFISQNSHLQHKEVDFLEFVDGKAGASPDGIIIDTITGELFGCENKCTTSWGQYYERTQPVDEKHLDFWQIQAEMLALKVKKLYYIVAEPPETLTDPQIDNVEWQVVDASPLHQQVLIHRCNIGHEAINVFLKGEKINNAVFEAAKNYEL